MPKSPFSIRLFNGRVDGLARRLTIIGSIAATALVAIAFLWLQVDDVVGMPLTISATALLLTLAACASLMALLVFHYVVLPMRVMAKAVEARNPLILRRLASEDSEIGLLSRCLMEHMDQGEEMVALNDELSAANSELSETIARVTQLNEELEARVRERTKAIEAAVDATIHGWSRALEARDNETEGHTRRVAEMSLKLAEKAKLSQRDSLDLYYGALLHDIGKLAIPDSLLLKPGKLTDEEYDLMKMHTTYGFEMLKDVEFLEEALKVTLYHHERWDGKGYPMGLSGDDIPFSARLFAVADVWDALRSDRPYRKAWSEEDTRKHIESLSGTHFDPKVVEIFMSLESMAHPSDERFLDVTNKAA